MERNVRSRKEDDIGVKGYIINRINSINNI